MYTTEHLIQDCVGAFIENKPYSINRSTLISDRQYCEIWTCIIQWSEKQIKRKNSFIIPHFGLIQYTNDENQRWKFYIQSRYLIEHNSKLAQNTNINYITKDEIYNSSAIKCCISSLSKYSSSSSLSESQLIVGLKHIFNKLFQQIGGCTLDLKILINFGWGYLSCCDGIIDFIFTLNESLIINESIPKRLKNIANKYLESNVKIINSSKNSCEYAIIAKQIENYKTHHELLVSYDCNNPLIYLSSQSQKKEELLHNKSEYPPVLSQFSRTLISTYCDHTNYETPSTKIGLFYTPTAGLYRINTSSKAIEYTNYLPFFQIKNVSNELKYKYSKSCQRYYEYLHNRMNEISVNILQNEMIGNIFSKLEPDLTLLSQEKVEEILENNLNDIQCEFECGFKQAILDYVLKNNRERIRLNILIPPHDIHEWGYALLPFSAPLSWNNKLQKVWNSMNNSSYFVNICIIQMLSLWQNYKHYRLFCVPLKLEKDIKDIKDIKKKRYIQPMRIEEFHLEQSQHLEFVRNIFINNWYNESVNIMKKYVEENQLDSSQKSTITLFCAIAAFMSCKLCEIVYESLKDCIKFFEQQTYDECLWKISLEYDGRDGVQYEIAFEEIDVTINEMITNISNCFDGIACVEGKIFALLENVPHLTVFIDEEIKKQTSHKILNVTAQFNQQLMHIKDLYSNKFCMIKANNELTTKLIQIENDDNINDNLSEFKNEIKKYQQIRENIINKGELRFNVGLFCVECQIVNSLIVNHTQDLKNAITNHVAKQLIDKAQQLVINYEDNSKKLLKKPNNATQLIDLIKCIKIFDESQLSKLQNISHEIGKELTFLFETFHPLNHDLLRNVARVSDWNRKIIQHKTIADKNVIIQTEFIKTMINEKSKQFEIKIKKLYQQVEGLNLLSEIKDEEKVDKVKENMKMISEEKEYIENEQQLLEIQLSQFKVYKLLQDAVEKL